MKVKPYSAADLLRQNSPRKFASSSNRFSFLRDESPALGIDSGRRFRSPSVKRKPDEHSSYSSMVSKNLPEQNVSLVQSQALEQVGINTAKVTSLCEKVQSELVSLGAEPEICTIFTNLCEAIRCINDSQKRLSDFQAENSHRQSIPLPAPPSALSKAPL